MLFSCTNNFDDFLKKLPILKQSNIVNILNNCEVHEFSLESYRKLKDSKNKFEIIFNYKLYKNYIFVYQ